MPSELRIIRFQLDEVTAAVLSLAPRIDLTVPETPIMGAHAAPDGSPKTLLLYGEAGKGIVIGNNQLAASLIAFCHKVNLPLPREGQKSIQVLKDRVDLRINMQDFDGRSSGSNAVETETTAPQTDTVPTVQVD